MNQLKPGLLLVLSIVASGCNTILWEPGSKETGQDPPQETGVPNDTDTGDTDTDDTDTDDTDTGIGDPIESAACDGLYPEPEGTRFYVDPASGADSNDGSQDAPWASLQVVFDTYVDCSSEDGTPKHSSAPIKGGDTIVLRGRDGYAGSLSINGCYNSDYVRVVAEQHREPVLRFLKLRGGAYWHFEGLTFEHDGGGQMFKVEDHSNHGTGHHIVMHDNLMTSGDLQTKSDFADKASDAIRLNQTDDVSITCNDMLKVAQAITVSGDRVDVLYNTIEQFSRDAIVNGGSYNRYIGNTVYDSVKLGDGHHDDFFQSHRGSYPDTSTEVQIAYNLFVNRYSDQQPAGSFGPTQCIGAFEEGPKSNWQVYNNVCKGDHYHGITLKDTNDSLVINNTVVGGSDVSAVSWETPDRTWINVSGSGNTLRNNLTTNNLSGGDHNYTVTPGNIYDLFVDWDGGDLRLKPDAAVVNAGSRDEAPSDDVLGAARDDQPDIGAYEVTSF